MSGVAAFVGNNALSLGCTGAGFAGIWYMGATGTDQKTGALAATVLTLGVGISFYQLGQIEGRAAPLQETVRLMGSLWVFPAMGGGLIACFG